MASMTMTTSLAGGSVAALTKAPAATNRPRVVMVKASSKVPEAENVVMSNKNETTNNSGRRELFFAMAAAAACSVAGAAMAEDEPKRGSPEAKKKYYQVCVSNPTARICRDAT
ncbi:photosystem II 5 kDa protein, chloroplastic-like [Lycium ferocissimum]|uniref:photosystem II 5 kDa protein, chloroplastic-like n=1 Tax=Lycium ferocissimum TaxID=112874 RepID=UPI0028149A12|nr:photosystem II 5 kDa protein, chloroplastic-like [Lycium ferocissimum]